MKKIGYEKAALRLSYAREALVALRSAGNDVALFTKSWTEFLIHINGVNDILERAAKNTPQARQWFGGKKNFSKSDELLQYLHQARNADDHGIEPVIKATNAEVTIRVGDHPGFFVKEIRTDQHGALARADGIGLDGSKLRVGSKAASYRLIPVKNDRFPQIFNVPSNHLGRALACNSPIKVAELGFAYHEALMAEAQQFVV